MEILGDGGMIDKACAFRATSWSLVLPQTPWRCGFEVEGFSCSKTCAATAMASSGRPSERQ
jgi:hypothetical protein